MVVSEEEREQGAEIFLKEIVAENPLGREMWATRYMKLISPKPMENFTETYYNQTVKNQRQK